MAVTSIREGGFLQPLPVTLLPLGQDPLRRLGFLGLRTLGQYAALPPAAVWQQFGRPGKLAHRCARGEDDRAVVPRWHEQHLNASCELADPLADRERLLALLQRSVSQLLADLRRNLQVCGRMRLTVHFADHSAQEQTHCLPFPTAEVSRVVPVLGKLLERMHWQADATALEVTLERLQDAAADQLTLFPGESQRERRLCEVQRYLMDRFGNNRLRRAMLVQPGAPLPEWRVGWLAEEAL
jgi:protein ImuB